ncbi:MAG TPA: YhdP family protein [Steroidobacteraceae bacterium]|nr:YhdP family protein [Steroidobacteraceae bacterium]
MTEVTTTQDSMPRRRDTRARRVVRWLAAIGGTLVVVLALALGTLRVLLTHVPDYRDQIQAWVNETTHLDVRFRELDARWRFFGPEIYITAVEVYAPQGGPLLAEARAASVGFDFWRALLHAELLPGRLRLIEPEIGLVRTADGRIELEGQAALKPQSGERRFTVDDLPTGRLDIADARVTFTDLQGKLRDAILTAVDITVRRGRNDLDIDAELPLPEGMGATLEVEGRAHGALSEPQKLEWQLALHARDLELAGWREQFGALANLPLAGEGNLRLEAHLNGPRLDAAKVRLQLAQVVLPAGAGTPSTRYPVLAGDFDLQRDAAQWQLSGRDVEVSTDRHRWSPSDLAVIWKGDARSLSFETRASYLRLENLAPFASLAPAGEWRERFGTLAPEGEVRAFRLSYARSEDALPDVRIDARFADVGFNPYGKFPGLRGLSGTANGSSAQGRATIESRALQLTMPQKFRSPLSADTARGAIEWAHDAGGWHIRTRQFELRSAHATADTDVDLTLPGDGLSPVLKLHSRFRDALVVEGWRYLPIDKLKGKVLAWLDAAFLAGRVPSGEFVIDGPTRKFPFRGGEGEFRVSFLVEGLTLHYAEGWPQLDNGSVDVEFRNAGLSARLKQAKLNGLTIEEGVAQIADFKEGDLLVKGRATGDAGAALGYMQGSPAGPKLSAAFMKLRGSGQVRSEVDLLLPIRHLDDRHIVIATHIEGARLQFGDTAHAVEKLAGDLKIEDKRISSAGLTGEYLGGPINIELTPTAVSNGLFENVVRVRGSTPTTGLTAALGAPESMRIGGRIDWRGIARIPAAAVGETPDDMIARPSVRLDSTLRGTEIELPTPVAKSASETRAMHVAVHWPGTGEAVVRASYGSNMRSQLRFVRGGPGWVFDRGSVRLGAGDVRLPTMPGLELRGTVDEFDLSDWLALRSGKPGKRPLSDYLRSADLTVHDLQLFGFRFSDVHANLLAGEHAWTVSVDGPQAQGTVLVPYELRGAEPLVLNMARLRLTPAEDDAPREEGREPDPRQWPDVNASIAEFEGLGKKLGLVRAELRRSADGLVLRSLATQASSFTVRGSGAWSVTPQGQQGALELELTSTDLLQTLRDLGYGDAITGKHGAVTASVTWPGAPDSELLGRLSGTMSIQIDDGQLLSVQPGAGRIFGLMSVAALPRRLSLDFTDFTDKGLAFDSVRGDFTLKSGDAYTQNLLLKGPAAEIGVVGRTGLGERDYDQTAVVTGSLGQSLPVAGALAGGPVVGAALLVFSQIFKEPLKGITRGYYRITGSWDNPVVQRVEDADKKKAENAVRTAERKADGKP